jgi:DNA-binding beta-propeller fold protein YncE
MPHEQEDVTMLSLERRRSLLVIAFALTALLVSATAAVAGSPRASHDGSPTIVPLANGRAGIGFDDVLYDRATNRLYVPGGRSGNLFVVDPAKARSSVLVSGFSRTPKWDGGHDFGITSVSAGRGFLFVTDRTSGKLSVIRLSTRRVVAKAKLGASPDIVRYVPATNELWVTEPDSEQIEVLTGPSGRRVTPRHLSYISVPGGPEALVIDGAHGFAYTEAATKTMRVNLKGHTVSYGWTSGCKTPKELALDLRRNLAFTACAEGGVYAVRLSRGHKVVSHVATPGDVDFPGYAPALGHLYISSGAAKKVYVIRVAANGGLTRLGTLPGALDSSNAFADAGGNVWVPRPHTGDIMRIADRFRTGKG